MAQNHNNNMFIIIALILVSNEEKTEYNPYPDKCFIPTLNVLSPGLRHGYHGFDLKFTRHSLVFFYITRHTQKKIQKKI